MSPSAITWAAPIGRILLSSIFVLSAVGKLQQWQPTLQMIGDKGLPAPEVFLSIAVGLELVGGILLVVGLFARWGALALLMFLVPVTLIMHNFWAVPQEQSMEQFINFMKNASITGGVVFVLAMGAGPVSIDALRQRRPRTIGVLPQARPVGPPS